MTGRGRCQEEALGAPCHLLTADILAQNALGLFHRCLQTKYWLLEGWGRGLSPRGSWVSQPHPRPHGPGPGLPRAPAPAAVSAGAPRAPRGRPGGWEYGRLGHRSWFAGRGRRTPESRLQGSGGGWAHLLQVPQQLGRLPHMAGLGLSQAVQDSVEGLLVEQGPLTHSRVTSGTPVHPALGLSPTSNPWHQRHMPRGGARGPRTCRGGEGAAATFPHPPNIRFLPPRGKSGGVEPQSGEQGEKTKCPGGLDRALDGDGSWQSRPGPRAQGLSLRPPGSHTCSHSRPPGGPAPGSPSSSPGLLWLRSIGAQLSPQREPQHPWPPPPFLPQRKQHCLSCGQLGTPAEVRPRSSGGSRGSHVRQAWGVLSGCTSSPTPAGTLPA